MLRTIRRAFRLRNKVALLQLARGMRKQAWLNTARALSECGVLRRLDKPWREDDLASDLGIVERDAFRSLIAEGIRLRLLKRGSSGQIMLRGRFATCLATDEGRQVDAMLAEVTSYHHEVLHNLPALLRGAPPQDYLARYGGIVAESSRLLEPLILDFMQEVLSDEPCEILEIGCGAGAYLVNYASRHAKNRGIGLDMSDEVVAIANEHLTAAGVVDRFRALAGDARRADELPDGPYDVITAHQNVYYFDDAERADLWTRCEERLRPNGRLAIVTVTQGGPMSDYFNLILRSTLGCTTPPTIDALCAELEAAGLTLTRRERFLPGDELWGIEAVKSS